MIDTGRLNGIFDEYTPLFIKNYPDDVPAALGKTTSLQKAAGSSQKSARAIAAEERKAAAAATAAARTDTTRRPFGNDRGPPPRNNDRYGPRFPPNYNGNQQNQYDINRDRRPAPDERSKNCGVFKYNGERLPWLKSQINPTGKEHPPTVCVRGNTPGRICMIGSTCGMICTRQHCPNIHLLRAADISDGMFTLNKYVRDFEKLDWINQAAAALANAARPGPLDQGR